MLEQLFSGFANREIAKPWLLAVSARLIQAHVQFLFPEDNISVAWVVVLDYNDNRPNAVPMSIRYFLSVAWGVASLTG